MTLATAECLAHPDRFDLETAVPAYLRKRVLGDQPAEYAVVAKHRDHLKRYQRWAGTMSLELALAQAPGEQRATERGELLQYFIMQGEGAVEDPIIGRLGFYRHDARQHHAFFGYWIVPPFEGLGIVSAAGRSLLEYGFQTEPWHLRHVYLEIEAGNERSQNLASSLGAHMTAATSFSIDPADGSKYEVRIWEINRQHG